MKSSEIRQKSKEELREMLREKRERLEELNALVHQKKTKNVKEAAAARKDIARMLTILKEHA